jgi:hypothetical protein
VRRLQLIIDVSDEYFITSIRDDATEIGKVLLLGADAQNFGRLIGARWLPTTELDSK